MRDWRLTTLKVDGGAAANAMLLQFQADLLGVPGASPGGARDHGARRGLSRRPGGGLLGKPG